MEQIEEPTAWKFKRTAETLLLRYFQSWGHSQEERQEALSQAAQLAKVEVNTERWEQFQSELDQCFPLGKFEEEAAAIESVIRKFREN